MGKTQGAEQIHSLSEQDYRLISEKSPIGISLVNAKGSRNDKTWGKWIAVNPAMCNLVGYTEEELLRMTFLDVTHPDDVQRNIEVIDKLLKGEENIQWEKRYINKYGHTIWVLQNTNLLRDQEGNPQYFLSMTQDITERRGMMDQLKQDEERFKLVQKATGDMIWDWDLVHDKIYVSENMKNHFKYDPEYINNKERFRNWWVQRIHPEDRDTITSVVDEAFKNQQHFLHLEYRFLRGDGKYAFLLGRAYIMYENGKPIRAIGANEDMTKRKEIESALRESEERYNLVVNHVSDLVSIIDPEVNYL